MKKNNLHSWLYIIGILAFAVLTVFLLRACGQSWRSHNIVTANLYKDSNKKEFLLIRYSYYTSGKGLSYRYQVLQSIDPKNGEKLGEYSHKYKSSWGDFSIIYQNEKLMYFRGKKGKPYCVSLPNLEEIADPEKITKTILEKNPQIKDVFELKVLEGVLEVNTSNAYTYWVSLENLGVITKTEALKIRNRPRDNHPKYIPIINIWKDAKKYNERDNWIKLASGQKVKKHNNIISIETIDSIQPNKASEFALNYAIVDTNTYRSFVLEGNLRRHFLEVLAEGKVRKLKPGNTYIKGIMLRPYREKGRLPTRRWAIISRQPYAAFVFHQSEMDTEKATFFLNKVNLESGKDLWKINLSELCEIKSAHYPEYNWQYDDRLICLFKGRKRSKLLCFSIKDGSLQWQFEI